MSFDEIFDLTVAGVLLECISIFTISYMPSARGGGFARSPTKRLPDEIHIQTFQNVQTEVSVLYACFTRHLLPFLGPAYKVLNVLNLFNTKSIHTCLRVVEACVDDERVSRNKALFSRRKNKGRAHQPASAFLLLIHELEDFVDNSTRRVICSSFI